MMVMWLVPLRSCGRTEGLRKEEERTGGSLDEKVTKRRKKRKKKRFTAVNEPTEERKGIN